MLCRHAEIWRGSSSTSGLSSGRRSFGSACSPYRGRRALVGPYSVHPIPAEPGTIGGLPGEQCDVLLVDMSLPSVAHLLSDLPGGEGLPEAVVHFNDMDVAAPSDWLSTRQKRATGLQRQKQRLQLFQVALCQAAPRQAAMPSNPQRNQRWLHWRLKWRRRYICWSSGSVRWRLGRRLWKVGAR